jgi:thiol-disulfide isomerase/thioredoxin
MADENDELEPLPPGESKESPPAPHGAVEGGRLNKKIPLWGKVLIMSIIVFLGGHWLSPFSPSAYRKWPGDPRGALLRKFLKPQNANLYPTFCSRASAGPNKHLSDFKGKVVLVSFWASWCTPCLIELPTFIDLHQKLSDKGLVIIPVNVDEAEQAASFVSDFWKTKKFPFPTWFDPTHQGAEAFQVDALPSNFVLDKKGRLVAQGYGANDWAAETSVHFIEQLLSEQ